MVLLYVLVFVLDRVLIVMASVPAVVMVAVVMMAVMSIAFVAVVPTTFPIHFITPKFER